MSAKKMKRLKMGSLVSIGKDYPVYKGLNLIGRNKEATIILMETEISHHHAIITIIDENNQYISDFGSCNGVFVDNKRLDPFELCKIHDGMVIKISTIHFTYIKDSHHLEETINQRNTQAPESVYSANTQFINESAFGKTQDQIPDDGFDFSAVDTQTIENNIVPTQDINEIKRASSKTDDVKASTSAQNESEKCETVVRATNALDELSEDSFDFNTVNTQMINASTEMINESNRDENTTATNGASGDGYNFNTDNSLQKNANNDEIEKNIEMGPITQAMDAELDRMEKFSEMNTQILPVKNNFSIHEAQTQIINCSVSSKEDEISNDETGNDLLERNQANEDENNKNHEEVLDTDGQSQLHMSQLTKKCCKSALTTQDFEEEMSNTEAQVLEERGEEMDDPDRQNESKKCIQDQNKEELVKKDSVDEKVDSVSGDDSGSDTDVEGNINTNSKFMNSMTDVEESFIEKRVSYLNSTDSIIPETQDCNDSFKASTSMACRLSNFADVIPCSQDYSSEDLSLRITSSASSNDEKKLSTIQEKSDINDDDEDVIESDDEITFPMSIHVLSRQANENADSVAKPQKTCENSIDDDDDTEEFDIAASVQNVNLESNAEKTNDLEEEISDSETVLDFDCATQKVVDSSSSMKKNIEHIENSISKIQTVDDEVTINGDEGALTQSNDIDFNCPTQRITDFQENSTISLQKNQLKDSTEMDTNSFFAAQTQKIGGASEDVVCDTDNFDFGAPTQKIESQSKSESCSDSFFLAATQKIVNSPKNNDFGDSHSKSESCSDSFFSAATQKIEISSKNNDEFDDFDFAAPTQPFVFKTNHKKQATNDEIDFDAPTQKISNPNSSENTDSFCDYDLPTQRICNTVETTVQQPDDDDIDYMAPTQKVPSDTYENSNEADTSKCKDSDQNLKDKVCFEMDTDFNTPAQDIQSDSIQINNFLETQPLEDVPVIKEPKVESQLEVMFDTETVHYKENAGCRPSNPMASVLTETSTQDIIGILDSENQNDKTPGKRMSNSEPDCEKPAKKPKEDTFDEVCSADKNKTAENNKSDVSNISEDLNKIDKPKQNSTEQTSGESSCNETNSSWSKKFSRLSTKRNLKNLSDEELINDNNDLMDMDFTNINNDADKNAPNVSILIEDSNDNELIILDDRSSDRDEDDNDNINKSAKKLRRKTHALVDDDLESQNLDTSAATTSSDNKTPKRTLRTRKPSESKASSSLYIVNLDNPDVSDFVETKVKMSKRRKSEANDILKNLDSVIMDGKRKRRGAPRKIAKIQEESSDEDDGKITFTVPKKQPQLKISDTEDGETVGEVILPKPKVLLKRGRKPKKEKDSEESAHEASDLNISVASRAKRILKYKVCFTLCDDPELNVIIRTLGGTVIEQVDKCNVLVTKQLQRTMKLLTAIGLKIPICSPKWLKESKSKGSFLDPWDYLIVDEEAETKWSFSLKESFNRSNSTKLFSGYFFQLQVTQSMDVLKGAIQGSGGKVVSRMPKAGNFVVVSIPENKKKYEKYLKQGVMVVSTESIFDGVLRQEIVFNKYLLT